MEMELRIELLRVFGASALPPKALWVQGKFYTHADLHAEKHDTVTRKLPNFPVETAPVPLAMNLQIDPATCLKIALLPSFVGDETWGWAGRILRLVRSLLNRASTVH